MYIGIDLGGTNIAAGLVDDQCNMLLKKSIPTMANRNVEEIVKDMAALAEDVAREGGAEKKDIRWVGIGSPGSVDDKNGVIVYANNIGFRNTPVSELFKKHWDIPTFLGNDANCAALGEAYGGAARNCDTAVMITLGTGVGGGVIIDKKIYSGFNGMGAELGHMVIVTDGSSCTCGRNGCWEAYSSATGLIKMTVDAMLSDNEKKSALWRIHPDGTANVSGRTAFIAAREGDATGQAVVSQYVKYLACGLVNIINIFQPEVLCLGGGISREGEYLLNPLMKIIENERYTRNVPQTVLKEAELGNDAGIIGAAMLGK